MRHKKPLTDSDKVKIAQILENTDGGSYDFLSLMIEMHYMGIVAENQKHSIQYWWDYIQPQLESVLVNKRFDGTTYPKYSAYLEGKIRQFADEVIQNWFFETFKVVSKHLVENDYKWGLLHVANFDEYCGGVSEEMVEVLDENEEAPNVYMFGLDKETINEYETQYNEEDAE